MRVIDLYENLRRQVARGRVADREPCAQLEEGDVEVGILPDDFKPLYRAYMFEVDEREALQKKLAEECKEKGDRLTDEDRERMNYEWGMNSLVYGLASSAFWNSVRATFSELLHERSIDIVAGWRVIKKPAPPPSLAGLFIIM